MEERDVSFRNYREKQEAFKAAQIKLKFDFDNDADPSGFKNMLNISNEDELKDEDYHHLKNDK